MKKLLPRSHFRLPTSAFVRCLIALVVFAICNLRSAICNAQNNAGSVTSTALEVSHVLKAGAGSGLVSFHCYSTSASTQFLLIMDSATVPAGTVAVTLLYPPIKIPAGSNVSLVFDPPLLANAGISVSNSSTGTFTKTPGAADCIFAAQVK